MLDIKQVIIDLLTTFLAAGVGIIIFRKMDLFHRLLFYQVILYICVDIAGLVFQSANAYIFSVFIPIETFLLAFAASVYLNAKKWHVLYSVFFGVFLLIYLCDILFVKGFCYHGAIAQGMLVAGIFLHVLYQQFSLYKNNTGKTSVTLISLGLVLYFACSIPYLCMIFYMQKTNPVLNQRLFQNIIVVLASLRYLLIAIAFLLHAHVFSRRTA